MENYLSFYFSSKFPLFYFHNFFQILLIRFRQFVNSTPFQLMNHIRLNHRMFLIYSFLLISLLFSSFDPDWSVYYLFSLILIFLLIFFIFLLETIYFNWISLVIYLISFVPIYLILWKIVNCFFDYLPFIDILLFSFIFWFWDTHFLHRSCILLQNHPFILMKI